MLNDIRSGLRPTLVFTLLFAALLGLAYPALIAGIGQIVFPWQANGSIVRDARGQAIGSAIIGQQFAAAKPLADRLKGDLSATTASPDALAPPADLVTASASGLDPDISPEAALYQAPRVAAARHVDPATVRALVDRHIERPLLGFIGEPRVNVLALNPALDAAAPRP